jgi:hypothetical protein
LHFTTAPASALAAHVPLVLRRWRTRSISAIAGDEARPSRMLHHRAFAARERFEAADRSPREVHRA